MYYINYFFVFSIFGHLLESLLSKKSGILYGYWTPVYGFGCLLILYIHKLLDKFFKKYNIKKFKALILFITSFIFLSLIELIGGILIKKLFGFDMWNYKKMIFNIGKYISIETAIIWGISSIILVYLIKPFLDKIIVLIPKYISYILILFFIIDCISTYVFRAYIGYIAYG